MKNETVHQKLEWDIALIHTHAHTPTPKWIYIIASMLKCIKSSLIPICAQVSLEDGVGSGKDSS